MTLKKLLTTGIVSAAMVTQAIAGTLVINSNQSDPAPKQAWTDIVAAFQAENPDITVKFNEYDHEGYKSAIRNWLVTSPPDIVFWFAGNRMKYFVDRGLFEDVSDVWESEGLSDSMSSTKASLTIDDKQYGLPFTYYQWGMYYNKDLFDMYGLEEPTTWEEFLKVCETLKANGKAPNRHRH